MIESMPANPKEKASAPATKSRPQRAPISRAVWAALLFVLFTAVMLVFSDVIPDVTRTPERASDEMMRGYMRRVAGLISSSDPLKVVMIGSSVSFIPNLIADAYYEKAPLPIFNMVDYSDFAVRHVKAEHMSRLLFGEPEPRPEIVDLSSPAAMICDDAEVFDKLTSYGKKPEIAILTLAPRDFVDNSVKTENTPLHYELRSLLPIDELTGAPGISAASARLFDWMDACAHETARRFKQGVNRAVVFVKKRGRKSYVPPEVVIVSDDSPLAGAGLPAPCLSNPGSHAVADGKPAVPDSVPGGSKSKRGGGKKGEKLYVRKSDVKKFYLGENKLPDLADYRRRYNPPDFKRFVEQTRKLEHLLSRIKGRGTLAIVVEMPLPRQNLELLDARLLRDYRAALESLATRYGALLVRPSDWHRFETDDFFDACHLNAKGAHECFSAIAKAAHSDRAVAGRLRRIRQSH